MNDRDPLDGGTLATSYLADLAEVLRRVPRAPLTRAVDVILTARAQGRRVYVFGNGGSSATASHFVCDLVKTAQTPGFAVLRAFSLSDNVPLLTAWANDCHYDETFSRMIEGLVEPGDVVIGISASGNSPNVVNGLRMANRLGTSTVALLGFDGGISLRIAQIPIHVPCRHYGLAEDAHSAIGHAITAAIRQSLEAERSRLPIALLEGASVEA